MVAIPLKIKFFNSGVVYIDPGQSVTNWTHTRWEPTTDIEIVGGHLWIGIELASASKADARLFIPATVSPSDANTMMRHSIHRHTPRETYVDHINLIFPSDARPVVFATSANKWAYWGYSALNVGTDRRGIQFAWFVWYIGR
jgi:hypothetical protein